MTRGRLVLFFALAVGLVSVATIAWSVARPGDARDVVVAVTRDEPLPTSGMLDGLVGSEIVGRELLPGTELRLSFGGGGFSVSSGCNDSDGGYRVRDGRLRLGEHTQTQMACGSGREAQDDWILDVLDGARVGRRDGHLVLESGDVVISLAADPTE